MFIFTENSIASSSCSTVQCWLAPRPRKCPKELDHLSPDNLEIRAPTWARPASEPLIPRLASSGTITVTGPLIGLNHRQASDSASMAAVPRSFENFNSITTWVGVTTFYFFLSTGWQKTVSLYFRTPLSLTLIDHCSARRRSLPSRDYRRAKYNKHCENNNTHLLQSDRRTWDAFVKFSQWVRIRTFATF